MGFFLICLQTTSRGDISFAKTLLKIKEILRYPGCNLLGLEAFIKPSYLDNKLRKQNQDFIWAIVFGKMF